MNKPSALLLLAFFFVFPLLAFSTYCPTNCSNLPTILYPFGAIPGCGLPGFELDCTSPTGAKWNLQLNSSMEATSYFVQGIDNQQSHGAVNLTWYMYNPNLAIDGICFANFSANDSGMNYNLFGGTDLSIFTQANLTFSESNVYLLLGCQTPPVPITDDLNCAPYFENSCPYEVETCVVFKPAGGNYIEPDLQSQYKKYQCTSYTSVVTSEPPTDNLSSTFQLGIQLNWTQPLFYSKCAACQTSKGTCGYRIDNKSFLCFCDNNESTETDCSRIGETKKPIFIGAIVGCSLLVLILCTYMGVRKRLKKRGVWEQIKKPNTRRNVSPAEIGAALREQPQSLELNPSLQHQIRLFSLMQLKIATRNFHDENKLGEGGFGSVYKGTLGDGQCVAIKKLSIPGRRGERQFLSEVKLITTVQHRNLIKLLGCCVEGSERLLVYEYIPNQSLDKHIFEEQGSTPLNWITRREIISGIAKGLAYLHEESQVRIIHRDIKPANVLLDDNLHPIITDFGLARLFDLDQTHASASGVAGTLGYLAPEYAMYGQLTEKADVFSYGLVVLEILSGRRNIDNRLPPDQDRLLHRAWKLYEEQQQIQLMDPRLRANYSEKEAIRMVHVALLCTQAMAGLRPAMSKVVALLMDQSEMEIPTSPAFLISSVDEVRGLASASKDDHDHLKTVATSIGEVPEPR